MFKIWIIISKSALVLPITFNSEDSLLKHVARVALALAFSKVEIKNVPHYYLNDEIKHGCIFFCENIKKENAMLFVENLFIQDAEEQHIDLALNTFISKPLSNEDN